MATDRMNENWRRIKTQIQSIWSDCEFADAEMKRARGSLPRMVDLIHDKTGEPRGTIIQKLNAVL
jgi:hypothetical protein